MMLTMVPGCFTVFSSVVVCCLLVDRCSENTHSSLYPVEYIISYGSIAKTEQNYLAEERAVISHIFDEPIQPIKS
jgi:hypothetical protein